MMMFGIFCVLVCPHVRRGCGGELAGWMWMYREASVELKSSASINFATSIINKI